MSYFDRWNDENREAQKQGKRDAERGYRAHRHDFDPWTERGAAYDDGYQEERRHIERIEEERREQEEYEEHQRVAREREWQRQEEQEIEQEEEPKED